VGASCFATILLLKFSKTAKPRNDAALVWEQSECLVRPAYPHITTTRCVDQPRQAQRSPARPSLAWPKAAAWLSSDQPSREINRAQRSPGWHSSQAYPVQSVRPARLPSPAQPSPAQPSPARPGQSHQPCKPSPAWLAPTAWPSPASQSWAAQPSKPILGSQLGPDWNPACQPGMCIFFFVLGCCAVRELF